MNGQRWYSAKGCDRLEWANDRGDDEIWGLVFSPAVNGICLRICKDTGEGYNIYLDDHFEDWRNPTSYERVLWDLEQEIPYIPQKLLDQRDQYGYTVKTK